MTPEAVAQLQNLALFSSYMMWGNVVVSGPLLLLLIFERRDAAGGIIAFVLLLCGNIMAITYVALTLTRIVT